MNLLPFVATGIGLGAVYGMSGVGLVVLYRASGTLNFAFGAIGALGAFCTWTLIQYDVPIAAAWIAGILVATLVSFLYGRVVSARLIDRDRTVRAICTLGFALFLLGAITSLWNSGAPRSLRIPLDRLVIPLFGVRLTYTRLSALLFAIVALIGIGVLLNRTRIGLAMRAIASSRPLSSAIGVRIAATDSFAWAVSGAFAGIAGLLLGDLVAMNPITLTFLVIPGIAAAVIGGLSSMLGAFIGGMVGGIAEAILAGVVFAAPIRSAAPYIIAILFIAVAMHRIVEKRG